MKGQRRYLRVVGKTERQPPEPPPVADEAAVKAAFERLRDILRELKELDPAFTLEWLTGAALGLKASLRWRREKKR